ncbi:kinase-like protein [Hypoxylon sp. NC1633]|nr:kinase-like protein [Hypoxylon sp. NC1633]
MAEVFPSEEKTEPFTAEELQQRLHAGIQVEDVEDAYRDTVPLDDLVVEEDHHEQGIRILVRPLTRNRSVSPGNHRVQWLALRAEQADPSQPRSKVLAVTQTAGDVNFSVRIPQGDNQSRPPVWCELYYDPASDSLILRNRAEVPVVLAKVSRADPTAAAVNFDQQIVPGTIKELSPATWRISVHSVAVLDFRILEKRTASLLIPRDSFDSSQTPSQDVKNSFGKRSFLSDADDGEPDSPVAEKKARKEEEEDGVVVYAGPKDEEAPDYPLPRSARTKEVAIPNGHALLEIQRDETAVIPGGVELDRYRLTKREQIATTGASSVFTAEHSQVPDEVITVKVLKTRNPNSDVRPPQETHGNVIRQADIWLREYQSQKDLEHESIVRLYGGDARYLSLYMEHVDGKDLAARAVWREAATDLFVGDRRDAARILRDIASALHYVHQKRKIHNDIKPANILYSRDRGAVLCDFGLSTRTTDAATNGGTPYYVPPEFIGQKLRGFASDVWALGVTMLYVLRKIPFPDARGRQGHPKQLYWMIADLNRRSQSAHHHPAGGRASSAVDQMRQWLGELAEAKKRLNPRDPVELLVLQMLTPNPNQRITMGKVVAEMLRETAASNM